ncbi:MAG: cob(I)yrinic acid a,c-diamide adenosyltransferase [Clostridia bacterium]|nr:cob(I)yrinic acid a,c-diamide adenosyltransferase [Clostridia bacterium]
MENAKVHVYYGNGKGKTTAAIGLVIRASGVDACVGIASFLKDNRSAERNVLRSLHNVALYPVIENLPFVFQMTDAQKADAARFYERLMQRLIDEAPHLDLLVLDEVLDAVETGMLQESLLLTLLQSSDHTEFVLTGRHPSPAVLEKADYITEMHAVRHPYDHGTAARRGIEY